MLTNETIDKINVLIAAERPNMREMILHHGVDEYVTIEEWEACWFSYPNQYIELYATNLMAYLFILESEGV